MSFQKHCADYLAELRNQVQNPQATSELSLRAALDSLLQNAKAVSGSTSTFTGEGKKIAQGRPDFVVAQNGVPIGYIEAEKYGLDLDKLSGHAKTQNERFIQNLDHFLLTNHLDFRLYHLGLIVGEVSLPAPDLKIGSKSTPVVPEDKAEKLLALFEQLMNSAPPAITSPGELAKHLSRRARQMNAAVLETLENPAAEIHNDFQAFKEVLLPNLKAEEFADLYAQTFAYGLFAARCNFFSPSEKFTRGVAGNFLTANPFLKKLFTRFAGELDKNLEWIADDMAALLGEAKMEEIREYFFSKTGSADPMIDFYEPFLKAYNSNLRDLRGVYYTPQPVVKYIVNSVHSLLQTHFKKPKGLADKSTLILDPATGTGSFLFATIDRIHEEIEKGGSGAWAAYVETHLLGRIFGFELMMAPYSIAHLKLGLQLAGMGAPIEDGERFGIYLTNTLDDAIKKSNLLMGQFVSDEANAAVKIKNDEPILVVLGNPPYSGHSANSGKDARGKFNAIGTLIENYKRVDGAPLGEKNPKWLQDDYVKFIAFAQERIRKTGEGVVAFITNHGYLDNPTFRGMRQNLLQTFDEIYVFDLHGNSKKKEKSPDGSADQNVFEIQQGVAILLAVKVGTRPAVSETETETKTETNAPQDAPASREAAAAGHEGGHGRPCPYARVFHADLWGKREAKYAALNGGDVSTTDWNEVQPTSPMYFFIPQNTDLLAEYSQGWKVTDIFPINSVGVVTGQDKKTIAPTFEEAKQLAEMHGLSESVIRPILYRPFNTEFIVYDSKVVTRQRAKVMHNMAAENLALITVRKIPPSERGDYFLATSEMIINGAIRSDSQSIDTLFPLYLYPDQSTLGFDSSRRPNLSATFLKALGEKLNLPLEGEFGLPQGITPEMIFHYAYAVFHAPSYRARYAAFLKTDFPRLPLTGDLERFRALADLGKQVVALHLLDAPNVPVLNALRHKFEGAGTRKVEKVEYSEAAHRVKINADQWFENVPRAVWEFRVGGYQVAEKWLKDRKGRVLSFDEISHYARVLIALAETIRVMAEIDASIESWPLA